MVKLSELIFNFVSFWTHFYDLPLECMTKAMVQRLGNVVGVCDEVDSDADGLCWGESLRVKVRYDITQPIRRGLKINIEGPMGGCWIPMTYESLPDYCYHYGLIGHLVKECTDGLTSMERTKGYVAPYGAWLCFQSTMKAKINFRRKSSTPSFSSDRSIPGKGHDEELKGQSQNSGGREAERDEIPMASLDGMVIGIAYS